MSASNRKNLEAGAQFAAEKQEEMKKFHCQEKYYGSTGKGYTSFTGEFRKCGNPTFFNKLKQKIGISKEACEQQVFNDYNKCITRAMR